MNIPVLYCTSRHISAQDKREYEYCFVEIRSKEFYQIRARFVKEGLATHRIFVINLKLCGNDTIQIINDRDIDAKYTRYIPRRKTWSGIHTESVQNCTRIHVKDLIAGHIVNHDIFEDTLNGRIKHGEVIKEQRRLEDEMIIGVGYILNDSKIKQIKQAYGPECTLEIMNAEGVRDMITTNPEVRFRLANFYAKQMYDPRYMHVRRIKSTSAKNFYNVIRDRYLNKNFLLSDPNLLYLLFIMYGHHMYTFEHSVDVAIYACLLYKVFCDSNKKPVNYTVLDDLFLCGLLHDIGKIYMPVSILDKKGTYDEKEDAAMYRHPEMSYNIIQNVCKCDSAIFINYKNNPIRMARLLDGARYHHVYYEKNEKNKSKKPISYPAALDSQKVNSNRIFLALITAADKLDGMISPRIYRVRRGKKAVKPMREYIGLEKAKKFLEEDAQLNIVSSSIIKLLTDTMMHDSPEYDFDDRYGEKITNIGFNTNIATNFNDITKDRRYVK